MVDCGYHRDGVDPSDPRAVALAADVATGASTERAGVYTHGGHSYDAEDAAAAAASARSRSWSRLKRSVWDNAVTNRLSTVREFSTMSEILRSVATEETSDALSEARRTLRESKPPFIVLLGGGMAAGKSTVVHRLKSDWE